MDRARGSDFRNIAQSVFSFQKYDEESKSKGKPVKSLGSLHQLDKWLNARDEVPKAFQDRVHSIFSTFVKLATKDAKDAFDFKKLAPIEFVVMPLFISVMTEAKMGLSQMAEKLKTMRKKVREEHVDVRMNDRVGKTLMEFVGDVVNGGGSSSGVASVAKRKREVQEADMDDDNYTTRKTSRRTTNNSFGSPLLLPSISASTTSSSSAGANVPKTSTPASDPLKGRDYNDWLAIQSAATRPPVAGARAPDIATVRSPTVGISAAAKDREHDRPHVPQNLNERGRDMDKEWERYEKERAREREKERLWERESGSLHPGGRVSGV
jgi:hypothetical protein